MKVRFVAFHPTSVAMSASVMGTMIVLLAIPLVVFRYLPFQDLANHEARLWLESSLASAPKLAQYYRLAWQPSPAIGLDLAVAPLTAFLGINAATRVFLVGTLITLAAGLVLLNRAIAKRASVSVEKWLLWPLTGLLFFYNKILSYGFLSFLAAAAAGLIVIALGLHWRGRQGLWRVAVLTLCAFVLLLGHGHAFACTALALAAAELGAQQRAGLSLSKLHGIAFGVGLTVLPFIIALAVFAILPGRYSTGFAFEYNLTLKVHAIGSLFLLYNSKIEALFTLAAGAGFMLAWWLKWLVVPLETRWMVGTLIAAWLVLPFSLAGSDYADYRLPIYIAWVLIAGSLAAPARGRQPAWAGIVLLALTAAETANIAARWSAFQPAYAAVDAALDDLPAGARVLTVSSNLFKEDRANIPPLLHAPLRSVWRRHAFVSGLFLNGGVPVKLRPDYAHLGTETDWRKSITSVDSQAERRAFFSDAELAGYDYLDVLIPGPIKYLIPKNLKLVRQSRWIALYRIPASARSGGSPAAETAVGTKHEAKIQQTSHGAAD